MIVKINVILNVQMSINKINVIQNVLQNQNLLSSFILLKSFIDIESLQSFLQKLNTTNEMIWVCHQAGMLQNGFPLFSKYRRSEIIKKNHEGTTYLNVQTAYHPLDLSCRFYKQ